jgi:hypothetical protein
VALLAGCSQTNAADRDDDRLELGPDLFPAFSMKFEITLVCGTLSGNRSDTTVGVRAQKRALY